MKHTTCNLFIIAFLFFSTIATAADVWEPKPGTGPETNVWRRVVTYGDQWSRHALAGHGGSNNKWRRGSNPYVGDPPLVDMTHIED